MKIILSYSTECRTERNEVLGIRDAIDPFNIVSHTYVSGEQMCSCRPSDDSKISNEYFNMRAIHSPAPIVQRFCRYRPRFSVDER